MARRLSRLGLWTIPVVVGTAAALVFATGFVLALRGAVGDPIGEPPPAPSQPTPAPAKAGQRRILVVGDSLARGTGDEAGKGFALDVLEALKKRGPAELTNLGVNGMESTEILGMVRSPNVRALAAQADVILVSAGGNDLSHAAGRSTGTAVAGLADAVAAARTTWVGNLREILQALREANPTAPIAVIGLYDPFNGQGGPGPGSSVILQWNALAAETAVAIPGVAIVPTFDIFQGHPDRLSADRYHPNRKGYAMVAERVLQAIG